jgi:hypothetical protein
MGGTNSVGGGRSMSITGLAVLLGIIVAAGAGIWVGLRRGPVIGVVWAVRVLVAGAVGYVALLALVLPM